jgi:hypothetical protein
MRRCGVSVFARSAHAGIIVVLVGMATRSGFVLTKYIRDEDAEAAWLWRVLFVATWFGIAWSFWRLARW